MPLAPADREYAANALFEQATKATTDLVSFPMSGKTKGRAELEYRLAGVIDSLAFGVQDTPLEGLLFPRAT